MNTLVQSIEHLDVVLLHLKKVRSIWGEVCTIIPKHRRRFAYSIMEDMENTLKLMKDTVIGELECPEQKNKSPSKAPAE